LVTSARGVAVTVAVGGCGVVPGAVYFPFVSTVPAPGGGTDHETLVSVGPITVAVNIWLEQVRTFAMVGEMVMVTGPEPGESSGASGPASPVGTARGAGVEESSQPGPAAETAVTRRIALPHPITLRMLFKLLFSLLT